MGIGRQIPRGAAPVTVLAVSLIAAVLAGDLADSLLRTGGPPPDLFLLYTGDVIGYIDPCG